MARLLVAAEGAELLQVPDVQAVGGRVEPDVEDHPARLEAAREGLLIGHLVNEAPPAEVFEQPRHPVSLKRLTTTVPELFSLPGSMGRGARV